MGEFIQTNDLRAVTAVGFSQGAPFALALAGHGLVRAVAIVSGQDELTHPRMTPLLHPDVAGMVRAVREDPAGFERSFSQMATPEGLWQLILGMGSQRDQAIYASETFAEAFRRALQEGLAQGPQGYARDLVNALGPWPLALEQITVPVDLWYGALDSTVHSVRSPDFGATLAERLPHASHTVDPQEGGSILWTRARDILTRLKAHLAAASA
jgi:pimeloyl-ACP methyl ester carboxylesterase